MITSLVQRFLCQETNDIPFWNVVIAIHHLYLSTLPLVKVFDINCQSLVFKGLIYV